MKASELSVGRAYITRSTAARELAGMKNYYIPVRIQAIESRGPFVWTSHGRIALCDILRPVN